MQAVLPFPDISPEIFSVTIGGFSFALRWYALAYIAGLLIGWRMIVALVRRPGLWPHDTAPMTAEQVERLLTWIIFGVLLGGRLGFVLFYQPGYYLAHPAEILRVWEGGMSFHGGLIGVTLAALLFALKEKVPPLSLGDALAVATPPGLMLGRIANFINAELWGRPSDLPWAVIFPGAAAQDCPGWSLPCARHPSQLYEALMEGAILGALLLWLAWRKGWLKAPGRLMGVFAVGYGIARFIVEFVRVADHQFIGPGNPLGHAVQFGGGWGLSMGQLLSLPMIALGLLLILRARAR
ncbi:prolipoprotein diacylglyceryl transferase [Haematobacter genomosp. 1]|uniref:Phosphatidylglycerol--prolipoprotein diacylglyceryl transferase n=1 Tax=Haematobacter genomosp. 1 TaxID=366618 RepID=A0A212AF30_9RHOB|nr:prolipoprotein diacylglyceryl transferase [Haematobacter genomosp. 1]OWJ80027.1 prolipoprotein diacylglyceryl transferase [Haematobacter genomosp. 1]